MSFDFSGLLDGQDQGAPLDPDALFRALPSKAAGYGYLRDEQGQVLRAWHARRAERDLVIKVNTGGGKTIDGLLILQSYLNEGHGPALYVAPSKYLVEQVRAEAEALGISTVEDVDSRRYLNSEAIGVVNINKLVNGRSVFSDKRPSRAPAPIGSVVLDDVHACVATLRQELALSIPRAHAAYDALLSLFEEDIRNQSPGPLLDLHDHSPGALARVPFWAWRTRLQAARALLHAHRDKPPLLYSWPAVEEALGLCRAVFTNQAVTITPPCPPIGHITSFAEAKHRVYLTATLADDSVLVTDFGADAASVAKPITPATAGDIGERMILAPQEVNPGLNADQVRAGIASLADTRNVVVLVPSTKAAAAWAAHAVETAHADDIAAVVERLHAGHVGLVVLVNKYDGIDLPEEACRVLVLDGLPEAPTGEERVHAQLVSRTAGTDDRQVQRIEQGMGRGVRSNEDHCVVFLLGAHLSQLVADPRSLGRFGPATQAQFALSRRIADGLEDKPLADILGVARQALDRDPNWVKAAKNALSKVPAASAHVSSVAPLRRQAFDAAVAGDLPTAADLMSQACNVAEDTRDRGRLREECAAYLDQYDPDQAQQTLLSARGDNAAVLRPLTGIVKRKLTGSADQAALLVEVLKGYENPTALRLAYESMLDDLVFDPDRTEHFEEALKRLGEHLGLEAQRPEKELGAGSDILWALGAAGAWVIEAKSGATVDKIGKRDANQLAGSANWFRGEYGTTARCTPVMVHPATQLAADATASPGMRILTPSGLDEFKTAVRGLAGALATARRDNIDEVNRLLAGHNLRANDLHQYLSLTKPGR